MSQVDARPVELVAKARAAGARADLVVGSVHDVVSEQLRAALEELGQRLLAVLGVKDVLLLHRHPRQLAPLLGDLAAQLGVLGLALCQLVAGVLPLLTCSYLRGHSVLLLVAFGVWTDAQPENHRSARAPPPRCRPSTRSSRCARPTRAPSARHRSRSASHGIAIGEGESGPKKP